MNKPGIRWLQRTATYYLSFSKGQLGFSDGLGQTWLKSFGLAPTSRTDGETRLSLPWSWMASGCCLAIDCNSSNEWTLLSSSKGAQDVWEAFYDQYGLENVVRYLRSRLRWLLPATFLSESSTRLIQVERWRNTLHPLLDEGQRIADIFIMCSTNLCVWAPKKWSHRAGINFSSYFEDEKVKFKDAIKPAEDSLLIE